MHDPGDPGDPPIAHRDPEVATVVRALHDLHVTHVGMAARVLDQVNAPKWLDPVRIAAVLTATKPPVPADNVPSG